jgi:ferredoxin-NADP reductase
MVLVIHSTVCTRKKQLTPDVWEFSFTKPEGFTFKPGQFILFEVPHPDNPEDIQTRAFSIGSLPSERELLFAVKMVPGGRASRWFEERVKEGTDATFKGPFGNFLLDPAPDKDVLFVATSTGVAPFRPQILDAVARGDTRRMDLIYGVRSEADVFWVEEFQNLTRQHPSFFLHLTLSRPSADWKGHRGRVQTLVPHVKKEFAKTILYACGSPVMTKEVKNLALTEWGMDKKCVHFEGYI